MGLNNSKVFLFVLVFCFWSCSNDLIRGEIRNSQKILEKSFKGSNLFEHVEQSYFDLDARRILTLPPTGPPNYECSGQYGEYYFAFEMGKRRLDDLPNYIAKLQYSTGEQFLISPSDFKDSSKGCKICNDSKQSNYPFPYFYKSRNLGWEVKSDVPLDLEVFVIEVEPGNFWLTSCEEVRPLSLGKWKNGYSRGYAVSRESDLIIFWVLVW